MLEENHLALYERSKLERQENVAIWPRISTINLPADLIE